MVRVLARAATELLLVSIVSQPPDKLSEVVLEEKLLPITEGESPVAWLCVTYSRYLALDRSTRSRGGNGPSPSRTRPIREHQTEENPACQQVY
jgi:hypothetical protein